MTRLFIKQHFRCQYADLEGLSPPCEKEVDRCNTTALHTCFTCRQRRLSERVQKKYAETHPNYKPKTYKPRTYGQ